MAAPGAKIWLDDLKKASTGLSAGSHRLAANRAVNRAKDLLIKDITESIAEEAKELARLHTSFATQLSENGLGDIKANADKLLEQSGIDNIAMSDARKKALREHLRTIASFDPNSKKLTQESFEQLSKATTEIGELAKVAPDHKFNQLYKNIQQFSTAQLSASNGGFNGLAAQQTKINNLNDFAKHARETKIHVGEKVKGASKKLNPLKGIARIMTIYALYSLMVDAHEGTIRDGVLCVTPGGQSADKGLDAIEKELVTFWQHSRGITPEEALEFHNSVTKWSLGTSLSIQAYQSLGKRISSGLAAGRLRAGDRVAAGITGYANNVPDYIFPDENLRAHTGNVVSELNKPNRVARTCTAVGNKLKYLTGTIKWAGFGIGGFGLLADANADTIRDADVESGGTKSHEADPTTTEPTINY